jgi:hypothetical protein
MPRPYCRTKPFPEKFSIPCPSCGVGMKAIKTRLVRPADGEPRIERYRYCPTDQVSLKTVETVIAVPRANRARMIERFLRSGRDLVAGLRKGAVT